MSETIATTHSTPFGASLTGPQTARQVWPEVDWDRADWTAEEYLALPEDVHAELVEGRLEPLTMPTWVHAWLVDFLHDLLKQAVRQRALGWTATAPVRVRTIDGRIREPDVVFVSAVQLRDFQAPSDGAELVMEVVSDSPKDRQRDLVTKVSEYASAGISEYWIVDPVERTITVLTLPAGTTSYVTHGVFVAGQVATSCLLDGFVVDVQACWDAAQGRM